MVTQTLTMVQMLTRSVSTTHAFLNRSAVMAKSSTQKVVTLYVTEAKLFTATSCTQDMYLCGK